MLENKELRGRFTKKGGEKMHNNAIGHSPLREVKKASVFQEIPSI